MLTRVVSKKVLNHSNGLYVRISSQCRMYVSCDRSCVLNCNPFFCRDRGDVRRCNSRPSSRLALWCQTRLFIGANSTHNANSILWRHKRLYTTFFTYAGVFLTHVNTLQCVKLEQPFKKLTACNWLQWVMGILSATKDTPLATTELRSLLNHIKMERPYYNSFWHEVERRPKTLQKAHRCKQQGKQWKRLRHSFGCSSSHMRAENEIYTAHTAAATQMGETLFGIILQNIRGASFFCLRLVTMTNSSSVTNESSDTPCCT